MSNPEISRRCAACGATVRQRAAFCPQCGSAVDEKSESKPFDPTETIAESRDARTSVEKSQPTKLVDEKAQTQALTARPARPPAANKVGKLKKVSSVVLDQAAYDPSVRFLLIAAGLFLVFIILLILSKVLG
jgi:endogenous inhibitor of DNA gyrase (YacG/DUF329 family)